MGIDCCTLLVERFKICCIYSHDRSLKLTLLSCWKSAEVSLFCFSQDLLECAQNNAIYVFHLEDFNRFATEMSLSVSDWLSKQSI